MPTPHRWEALLPEAFQAEFDRAPIAYMACGAMEEHGLLDTAAANLGEIAKRMLA